MKSYSSSSSVYKSYSADLYDFKMNLTKTLNSNYLSNFNEPTKTKRHNKISSNPCIPVKVIPNANYYTIKRSIDSDNDSDSNESSLIKSKFNSPFLFRKTSSVLSYSVSSQENVSTCSLSSSQSDSGLSSINSTELFIADLKECFLIKQSLNKDYLLIQFMNQIGTGSILRSLVKKYPDKWFYQFEKSKMMHQQQQSPLDKTNLETLEILLQLKREENIPITEIADQDGNSLMHKAILYNQYEVVRYLLVNYPSLLATKNCFGFYPIHLCVVKANMQMLRLICRDSKKYINKRDFSGLTPAMHAAIEGKYETLKYLIDNASAKYTKLTKKDKYSLLHLAVQSGSLDSVQYLLLKMGISYLKLRTKDGATVFHLAAARGHDHILEYLLANRNSKLVRSMKDITGSTPAHDASENGHYKCLKLLYDAGLDMFEQDMEHITPYDLAMASKNPDCRNFAINLKPILSFEDGPIQINSSSFQNVNSDSNSININNNLILPDSNNIQQTGGTKKINLRKISSMLRLRRAKDLNQNEPAYLYTQRFRPAPVSLPQSSQITGFKNGAPSILHENEDDLNDSAIDEIINQVNSSSNTKTSNENLNKNDSNKATKKKDARPASPSLNAAINKRISRYQQHCQQELESKTIENENFLNKLKTSLSPHFKPSTPDSKRKSDTHLNSKLKSSLSSSHGDSTPTLLKLSKSESVNMLTTNEKQNDLKLIQKVNKNEKNSQMNTTNDETSSKHSEQSVNSNFKLGAKLSKDENDSKNKSNLNQRKTVAFEDQPPVLIEPSMQKTVEETIQPSKEEEETNSKEKNSISDKNGKIKRPSLTKLIGNSLLLTNKPALTLKTYEKDEKAYDRLSHDSSSSKTNQIDEPEPDYWDVPSENQSHKEKSQKPIAPKMIISDQKTITTVSLAEIIVKSISSGSNSTNKSSSSSSISSVASEFKKQVSQENSDKELEKAIMPIKSSDEKSSISKHKNSFKSNSMMVFTSLNEFDQIKNDLLTKSSLNRRYLKSLLTSSANIENQEANKLESSPKKSPVIPDVDYNDDKLEMDSFSNQKLDSNYSSNHYSSLLEEEQQDDKKSNFINTFHVSKSVSCKQTTSGTSPPPPPPPLPPPPPIISTDTNVTRTLVTTFSSESLVQAKQNLKNQSLSQSLPESNELLISSSPTLSISSNENNKSPSSDQEKSISKQELLPGKKNDFFLKEIQNHRLYNTKKDYVLAFLDRNNSSNTYTNGNHQMKPLDNTTLESNNNSNNKACIIEVNNTNNSTKQMNRTLSSVNFNKQTDANSLLDDSSNTYSLSKSESLHSNQSDLFHKPNDPQKQQTVVQPKIVSNYERFPYIRNRQIAPQPKYFNNNYANYFNLTKRTKSNGPDPSRSSTNNLPNKNEIKPIENQLNKNSKSVSADHLNQLDNLDNNESSKISLLNEQSNRLQTQNRSLVDLASHEQRSSSVNESTSSKTSTNDDNETSTNKPLLITKETKKFRQFEPIEKTESELDRVFKVNHFSQIIAKS